MHTNSPNTVLYGPRITREMHERLSGHKSMTFWFTGLPGAGKSTLAYALEERLYSIGCRTIVLDGDNLRHRLCSDLGFSKSDRSENIRRVGEVAKLFMESGAIVLAALISPFRNDREMVRQLVGRTDFVEVYCKCSLEACERRDVKNHYQLARLGKIPEFTGISSPYEVPETPDLAIDTENESIDACVRQLMMHLLSRGVVTTAQEASAT